MGSVKLDGELEVFGKRDAPADKVPDKVPPKELFPIAIETVALEEVTKLPPASSIATCTEGDRTAPPKALLG